jgi:hypothetical protein
MSNKFGVFVNLDYAHKAKSECSIVWNKISAKMLEYGFLFKKRTFAIITEKHSSEVSLDVRRLFDEIQLEQQDFYSYLTDCYILNLDGCNDLTFPDTSSSIEVEYISLQNFNTFETETGTSMHKSL